MDEDAFADGLAVMLRGEIVVVGSNEAMPEDWPGTLS